ncbi:MAG: ABC transporter permease, partial [Acutalibacteraceae bacterium]
DYILGYTLPLIPLSLLQIAVCFAVSLLLGLKATVNILLAAAVMLPSVILYIAIGLLCGTVFTDKQVGSVCGALLTNLTAWLSGIWFSLDLLGATVKKIAFCLPFANAVESVRAAVSGNYGDIMRYLTVVIIYAAVFSAAAVLVFALKMKSDNK